MADKKYTFAGKLDAKTKRDWIKALRSGKYTQAPFDLENHKGNCCLGVLCKITNQKAETRKNDSTGKEYSQKFFDGSSSYLTPKLLTEFGLTDDDQRILTDLNDNGGKTFPQIARIIERNIKVKRKVDESKLA